MNDKEKLIHSYYREELKEAHRILLWSTSLLIIGVLFFLMGGKILQAAAYPIVLFTVIQFISAWIQRARSQRIIRSAIDEKLISEQVKVMTGVVERFKKFRTLLLSIFLLGFFLMLIGAFFSKNTFMIGTGIGLVAQAAIILVLDLFGEFRANEFLRRIQK
ncbi:MAG: hypothetical protein HKN16_02085 [Saprospiraceae bacterium]|nr:hypothetical protein [Saprospiraceae bacterium]